MHEGHILWILSIDCGPRVAAPLRESRNAIEKRGFMEYGQQLIFCHELPTFFLQSLLITISYKLSFTNVTFSCKYTTHLRHVLRTWYLLYSSCRKKKRPFRTFVHVSEEYSFNSYTLWDAFGFVNGHIVLYWFCISVSEIRKKQLLKIH
jgi:hypothetical protein